MMASLAALVVRRRWAVIALWIVVLVGAGSLTSGLSKLTSDFGAGTSTESGRVSAALDKLAETGGEIAVIADGITVDDPATARALRQGLAAISGIDGVIAVADPWSTGAKELRASDGRAALAVITLTGGLTDEDELALAHRVEDVARDLDAPTILVGGTVLVGEQFETASTRDLLRGEAIALPIAFLVMIFLLRGIRGASMPMLVAAGGVVASLAVLVGATYLGAVSIFSLNVANMLGIGLGIDYGLLMVTRFREERGLGHDVHEAVERTVATAGRTIVFSALTVAAAMSGLFVFGIPLLASFGIAGLGVVLLCMAAAVTLLPAVLALAGGKIPASAPTPDVEGRFFRLTRWVQAHAKVVAVSTVGLLLLLGTPFLGAHFEIGDARTLPPSSEVRQVALTLADRFPARGTDPVTVVAHTDAASAEFTNWMSDVTAMSAVAGTSIRPGTPPGTTVVDIVPTGTSQGPAATAVVKELRTATPGFDVQVGGVAAELVDIQQRLSQRLPFAGALVVLATLVLLFLMTGSLIAPVKAVLMSILSLGASFGALVWIFQDGHLSGLLGFESVGALDLWMPVLILIFAFGLSMDYEVFLLSRIKEVHDALDDTDQSVAVGLQRSGRIITSAALLIVIVFAGFAAGEVLAVKQLGVGLAIAVLVDATIVRTLLVPAAMRLLGDLSWWAPAPLRRLHTRIGLHETATHVVSPTDVTAPALIVLDEELIAPVVPAGRS